MDTNIQLSFERPILELENKINELETFSAKTNVDLTSEIDKLKARVKQLKNEIFSNLTAWQKVQLARYPLRPLTKDYIKLLFTEFIELYGDKHFKDDPTIVTGLGIIENKRVMLIGQRKGRNTMERMKYNFGSPHPEGYRKALQKMKLAEKLNLPIISLINTPGAYPGIGAEERGQAFAIAENIMEMFSLRVPLISIVIGEGGSGGALGIGVGDKFAILENAYYSVISPEGCAAILWRDGTKAQEAAEVLQLTPDKLKKLGVVDEIIPEPLGGAHKDPQKMGNILKNKIVEYITELSKIDIDELLKIRYEKYRKIGIFRQGTVEGLTNYDK